MSKTPGHALIARFIALCAILGLVGISAAVGYAIYKRTRVAEPVSYLRHENVWYPTDHDHWSGVANPEIAPMQPVRIYDDSWMDGP